MRHLNELFSKLGLSKDRGILFQDDSFGWSHTFNVFNFETIDKLNRINPDAVYHFNNQPFILFFDSSLQENKSEKQIFREVWSWDKVPVVFILTDGKPRIFNAFHYQYENNQLKEIRIASEEEIIKRFSFWELQSGNTWKWLDENIYKSNIKKHRVNYNLFNNIKEARIHLSERINNPLSGEFANILILRLIFIRYLIDRGVKIDNKFISGSLIEEKRNSLSKLILNQDSLKVFFNYLKERFNGNLFETEKDPKVTNDHLNYLSKFFSANLPKKQYFIPFLDVFDFSIIPVETISGIYESVIDDKKRKENSAVYTPLFLVDYILSKTVDTHLEQSISSDCKVLDPSVGSGVFLTQTLRRIIKKELDLNGKSLCPEKLKKLVTENLFGIDKDINALHVAAFSIYISILDYKEPKEIDNFQLPDLIGSNLIHNDFFNLEKDEEDLIRAEELKYHKYNERFKNIQFSYILGNPPWGSKKDYFHLKYINSGNFPVTDFQVSQSFLLRTKCFSNENTNCALIPSSGVIHKAERFRKYFLNNFEIDEVLDLSPSRFIIFEGADAPALVLFFHSCFSEIETTKEIDFSSLKPNIFISNFNLIVFEEIDVKRIEIKYFLKYSWMWKLAVYGNTIDFHFLKRFSNYKNSINDFIEDNDVIFKGNGILRGNEKNHFPFLEGLNIVETKNGIKKYFTHVDENTPKLSKEDIFLEAGRTEKLFKGEHVLLRRRTFEQSDIVISYAQKDCVIRNSAYIISSESDIVSLKVIYGIFISKFFTYFQFLTSENWGVFYPEINLKEYLSFPYSELNKEELIKLVDIFISYYKDYYSQELKLPKPPVPETLPEYKKINQIVNETYKVNDIEKDMIDYVLDISRFQFQEGKLNKILRSPTITELESFAGVFFEHYETVYNEDSQFFQVEIYNMHYFIAMKFMVVSDKPDQKNQIKFGNVESEEKLFKVLAENLSIYEVSNRIFIQKNVIGFEKDWFYLIKPNEYKSWHKAMAHYDIAEFDNLIMKAELEELKENG